MSYSISCFVEKKNKNGEWEIVSPNWFCWDFKNLLIDEDDWHDFDGIDKKTLSSFLKEHYELDENGNDKEGVFSYTDMKTMTVGELKAYANKYIDEYETATKYLFSALGSIHYQTWEYEDYVDDKYDEEGNINPSYNPLTFPINKDMIRDWNNAEMKVHKAYRIFQLCETAAEIAKEGVMENDKVRFVFNRG